MISYIYVSKNLHDEKYGEKKKGLRKLSNKHIWCKSIFSTCFCYKYSVFVNLKNRFLSIYAETESYTRFNSEVLKILKHQNIDAILFYYYDAWFLRSTISLNSAGSTGERK